MYPSSSTGYFVSPWGHAYVQPPVHVGGQLPVSADDEALADAAAFLRGVGFAFSMVAFAGMGGLAGWLLGGTRTAIVLGAAAGATLPAASIAVSWTRGMDGSAP